jgi:hypothetical protein
MSYRLNLPPVTSVCGKVRHYSLVAADAHRAALQRWDYATGVNRLGELVTYWCEQCKAFHVGHKRIEEQQ